MNILKRNGGIPYGWRETQHHKGAYRSGGHDDRRTTWPRQAPGETTNPNVRTKGNEERYQPISSGWPAFSSMGTSQSVTPGKGFDWVSVGGYGQLRRLNWMNSIEVVACDPLSLSMQQ